MDIAGFQEHHPMVALREPRLLGYGGPLGIRLSYAEKSS